MTNIDKIFNSLIDFHLYCVYFAAFMLVVYFICSQYEQSRFSYIKRIRLLLPLYYMSLACVGLSGFSLWAMKGFAFSESIAYMLLSFILILLSSIKVFKEFKLARKMRDFRGFKLFSAISLGVSLALVFTLVLKP